MLSSFVTETVPSKQALVIKQAHASLVLAFHGCNTGSV